MDSKPYTELSLAETLKEADLYCMTRPGTMSTAMIKELTNIIRSVLPLISTKETTDSPKDNSFQDVERWQFDYFASIYTIQVTDKNGRLINYHEVADTFKKLITENNDLRIKLGMRARSDLLNKV